MNQALRRELLALAERDQSFLDTYGWPGESLVGEDGAAAAWTLAPHTMPDPDVLRRCLRLLRDAAAAGEAELWRVAFLVEDPDHVETRRRAVGLPPLEQDIRRIEQSSSGN